MVDRMHLKKKSKVWTCKHGCTVDKAPCTHLEKLLPKPRNNNAVSKKNSDKVMPEEPRFNFEQKCKELEEKLRTVGLESFRIELIMDRYISRLTLAEIAEKQGYVNGSAVQYLIKQTLQMLKNSGHDFLSKLLGDYQ